MAADALAASISMSSVAMITAVHNVDILFLETEF